MLTSDSDSETMSSFTALLRYLKSFEMEVDEGDAAFILQVTQETHLAGCVVGLSRKTTFLSKIRKRF
uniref:Uncharacterized protein n=1 Tax=Sphaerodactylus townsendi TaxID=933632 RepID=A0ACB8FTW0_9SAUR